MSSPFAPLSSRISFQTANCRFRRVDVGSCACGEPIRRCPRQRYRPSAAPGKPDLGPPRQNGSLQCDSDRWSARGDGMQRPVDSIVILLIAHGRLSMVARDSYFIGIAETHRSARGPISINGLRFSAYFAKQLRGYDVPSRPFCRSFARH
jgi:hypothetical protein